MTPEIKAILVRLALELLFVFALYKLTAYLLRRAFDKRCQMCGMPYAIYRRAKTMDLCRKHMKIHDSKHRSPRNPMKYEGRDAPLGGFNGEFD